MMPSASSLKASSESFNSSFEAAPIILAGDPAFIPSDSPASRIDPNVASSPYAGVVSLNIRGQTGNFLCSGTAISPRHILIAAHCLDLAGADGEVDVQPSDVTVYVNQDGNISARIIASDLDAFPEFKGFYDSLGDDLAIVTLSQDLPPGVPIYPIQREPIAPGTPIIMVGYGATGDGIQGEQANTTSFTRKRVGYNQVEDVTLLRERPDLQETFIFDFDAPDGSSNGLAFINSGPGLGNTQESTLGHGDSGGPSFVDIDGSLKLFGVNGFIFNLPDFTIPEGSGPRGLFGSGGGGVVLADPAKLDWIDNFLPAPTSSAISGFLWEDLNQNGLWDLEEDGLDDWWIYLDENGNQQWDLGEQRTRSSNGSYTFDQLLAGRYRLAVERPSDWQPIFPGSGITEIFTADFSQSDGLSLDGFTIVNDSLMTGAGDDGLWHLSQGRGRESLYFGQQETNSGGGNYDVGHTAGWVTSPSIDLRGLSSATLEFDYWLEVEVLPEGDRVEVQVARDGEPFMAIADKSAGLPIANQWQNASLDLEEFLGSEVRIRFSFDSLDEIDNQFEGWYLDEVTVKGVRNGQQHVSLGPNQVAADINFGFVLPPKEQEEEEAPPEDSSLLNETGFFTYAMQARWSGIPLTPVEVGGLPFHQIYDESAYLNANPDVAAAVQAGQLSSGYSHFVSAGWLEGRSPSSLFDEAYYRQQNPDIAAAIATGQLSSGFQHFALIGHIEGRNPNAWFSQADYRTLYPDVASTIGNGFASAFEHYVEAGSAEGRLPQQALFNEGFYRQQNPDIAAAIAANLLPDGLSHYRSHGCREGRQPNPFYSEARYLELNPDVAAAVSSGLLSCGFDHYISHGRFEDRPIA